MTLIFAGVLSLLTLGITFWLGRSLWRGHQSDTELGHHAVNAAVLRDQLTELERDLANKTLSRDDFHVAKQELQQRALDEAVPGSVPVQRNARHTRTAVTTIFIVTLPLAAVLLYLFLGSPAAILPTPAQNVPAMTQDDIQNMVASLEERLAGDPDDHTSWLMLARSYRYFERHDDAADAFTKAMPIIQSDPLALTEYAETLAQISDTGFTSEAIGLLERALSLDPDDPFALTLAGVAAFQHGAYPIAIDYWQRLLEQLPPDSDVAEFVHGNIDQARERMDTNTSKGPALQ